jgi:hypothetical protein
VHGDVEAQGAAVEGKDRIGVGEIGGEGDGPGAVGGAEFLEPPGGAVGVDLESPAVEAGGVDGGGGVLDVFVLAESGAAALGGEALLDRSGPAEAADIERLGLAVGGELDPGIGSGAAEGEDGTGGGEHSAPLVWMRRLLTGGSLDIPRDILRICPRSWYHCLMTSSSASMRKRGGDPSAGVP